MPILEYAVFISKIKFAEISKKSRKKTFKCVRTFSGNWHRMSRFLICFKGDIKHRIPDSASFLK